MATRQVAAQPQSIRIRPGLGYCMIIGASALFAVNGSVSKFALMGGLEPARLTALRVTGAFVVLLLITAVRNPASLRVSLRELPMLAVYGLVGVALIQYLYFVAILRLPVGIALLLEFTGPVLVALYARVVQREQVRRRVWLAIGLCLAGLALVVQIWRGGGGLDPVGLLAGAGSALALAAYFLIGQHAVRSRDPLSLMCWTFFFAVIFWAIAAPWWSFDWSKLTKQVEVSGELLSAVSVPVGVLVASVILLGTVAPYLLSINSLRHVSATRAGIVGTAEPVIAAGVSWIWLGEALNGVQVVGGLVVLGGIGLAQSARDSGGVVPEPV
jgi:drug/metabolite transporter (DMT)-like permease